MALNVAKCVRKSAKTFPSVKCSLVNTNHSPRSFLVDERREQPLCRTDPNRDNEEKEWEFTRRNSMQNPLTSQPHSRNSTIPFNRLAQLLLNVLADVGWHNSAKQYRESRHNCV